MSKGDQVIGIERDLYCALLELRDSATPRAMLEQILSLVVSATNAERGYLETFESSDRGRPCWTITCGCSTAQADDIGAVTSRGIVSAALAANTTLHVPYASLDARFEQLPSVRDQRLEAVLCVPLGNGVGIGVLYLEGRRGEGPFSSAAVAIAERTARQIWPNADHFTIGHSSEDPTQIYRQRLRLDGVLGRSRALAKVFEQIAPFAKLDVTMFLTGENGTGKTQLARAIHDNSARHTAPFVEVNCAAIPETLLESELFGVMPGAFTGARKTPGRVGQAEGGTLFLDEVAELPYATQGKLLQLLQSRQFQPLGAPKLSNANIRIIAATNADLQSLVAAKQFREDLFYRLNVVNVRVPNLTERRQDIPILVDELLLRIAEEHGFSPLPASGAFRIALEHRDWPGNVRQLRNTVQAALIRACAEGAPQIEVRHLAEASTSPEQPMTYHEATRAYQRELLRRELQASGWSPARVSERLELTRSHVYNLMNQFNLRRE